MLKMRPIKKADLIIAVGAGHLDSFGLVCQADAQGRGAASRPSCPERELMTRLAPMVFAIGGDDENARRLRGNRVKEYLRG